MPVEKGVEFEDEEGLLPIPDAADQEDEPQAVTGGEAWLLALAVQDNQLLTQ